MRIAGLLFLLLISQMAMTPPEPRFEKVWVFFTDKDAANYDPYTFLDQKAIQRRHLEGIPVYDITDAPVNSNYINSVESITSNNRAVSRWFNAMCCLANSDQIRVLENLEFVREVKVTNRPLNQRYEALIAGADRGGNFEFSEEQRALVYSQLRRMSGGTFRANKINGTGVRIAIFDIGFKSYLTNPVFEHIRSAGRIKHTFDFVKKKPNVDLGGTHGTFVFSCIGGKIDGIKIGLATESEYMLARTETRTEFFSEEENWLAASEWADRNGADIISSSLGYTYHRYFREDMDGEHSLVAKAANMAAAKGILVINSAGNEGGSKWKFVGTPADADSVLSIGGIRPESGVHTSFSSFGPTWDKRLKPNVTSYGHVLGSGSKGLSETQGTSFSCPLVAGFAACAKQSRPGYKCMALFKEIEASGDLYPYFDYAHGYGVPQATHFFRLPLNTAPTFVVESTRDRLYIRLNEEDEESLLEVDSSLMYHHERYIAVPDYVFYHIENNRGYLTTYFVVNPRGSFQSSLSDLIGDEEDSPLAGEGPLVIKKSAYARPYTVRVFYKGFVKEIEVK